MSEILLNSLDILTFVVPPILPAALTANNAFAQRRLGTIYILRNHFLKENGDKKANFCLRGNSITTWTRRGVGVTSERVDT